MLLDNAFKLMVRDEVVALEKVHPIVHAGKQSCFVVVKSDAGWLPIDQVSGGYSCVANDLRNVRLQIEITKRHPEKYLC